ncbi:MAG: hypothetical protein M3Q07_17660, partial [Pseudobdellovibrionaceae bacterium]|nr:hypothetical protein [Pseudobdellovibrionaceae bacterium]
MRAWLFAIFIVTTLVFTMQWFGPSRSSPEWRCSADCDARGRQLEKNLFQLTGLHLQVGQTSHPISELADPAPPYFAMSGAIEIYGTAAYFLRYENWHEFNTGGSFERRSLDLRYPNGEPYVLPPWDLRKYAVFDGQDLVNYFLVGASMNATGKGGHPVWPRDNATRSIYFYEEDNERWTRRSTPIVWNAEPTWEGHSYGGNFFQLKQPYPSTLRIPKSDDTYFFYERSHIVKD